MKKIVNLVNSVIGYVIVGVVLFIFGFYTLKYAMIGFVCITRTFDSYTNILGPVYIILLLIGFIWSKFGGKR